MEQPEQNGVETMRVLCYNGQWFWQQNQNFLQCG
jgi:hypothetical protein